MRKSLSWKYAICMIITMSFLANIAGLVSYLNEQKTTSALGDAVMLDVYSRLAILERKREELSPFLRKKNIDAVLFDLRVIHDFAPHHSAFPYFLKKSLEYSEVYPEETADLREFVSGALEMIGDERSEEPMDFNFSKR